MNQEQKSKSEIKRRQKKQIKTESSSQAKTEYQNQKWTGNQTQDGQIEVLLCVEKAKSMFRSSCLH